METSTFYQWLIENHKNKDNPFGDFTKDTLDVTDFPKNSKDYDTLIDYLQQRGGFDAMETFNRLYIAYAMEQGFGLKKIKKALDYLDEM